MFIYSVVKTRFSSHEVLSSKLTKPVIQQVSVTTELLYPTGSNQVSILTVAYCYTLLIKSTKLVLQACLSSFSLRLSLHCDNSLSFYWYNRYKINGIKLNIIKWTCVFANLFSKFTLLKVIYFFANWSDGTTLNCYNCWQNQLFWDDSCDF